MEHLTDQEIADKHKISIRTVEAPISNAMKYTRTHLYSTAAIAALFYYNC